MFALLALTGALLYYGHYQAVLVIWAVDAMLYCFLRGVMGAE